MEIRSNLSSKAGSVFSKDVLRIELCGPEEDYLTVIDVPGIFRDPTDGFTTDNDIELVREMVKGYIKDARTVILAILPSNVDLATQEILKLAKDYDANGERTLGVLTKPDLVIEHHAKAAVCALVLGDKRPLTLGYHLVRNQGADKNTSFDHEEGEKMFNSYPWNSLPRDRIGIHALRQRLGKLLSGVTEREFPELRQQIYAQIESCQKSLNDLGPARHTEQEKRAILSGIARRFQIFTRAAREARYSEDAEFIDRELRLLTRLINLGDIFSSAFKTKALLYAFDCPVLKAPDNNKDSKVQSNTVAQKATTNPSGVPLDYTTASGGIDTRKFPELEQIIGRAISPADPKDNIKAWIRNIYLGSRGFDLGTFGYNIFANVFKLQTTKWESMTREYMSHTIIVVHRFLSMVLDKVCATKQLRDKIWSSITGELVQRYKLAMSTAMTLVNLQKIRGTRVAKALEGNARHEITSVRNGQNVYSPTKMIVDLDAVKETASDRGNMEHLIEEIHDMLWSYYKVARKRFVDNVHMQAMTYCLLTGPDSPLDVFSQEWVINLSVDKLEEIASESRETRVQRMNLEQKVEDLKSALEIL
ncbi:hypothetical protein AbraIFM66951_010580 [Aspergillus brasiliensis]|uniref:GED domain-containing protein n=1 Tax=Aspergillus brasiliensis TaxID=319629 RepID=A0A9W6DJQ8_9EURO|nr:hypothetical protein AbraCBS73388_007309 [Aspergillus brasiliensis]GKZ47225.1 hypothetical protein AbraIFM66951_010580 [Aspergillus brasiliensis]